MNVARRFRGTVAVSLFILSMASTGTAKYSGGTGEPNDPYQIASAADLIALGEDPNDYDKHFILTADIDLDPNLPGGKVFDKAVIAPDTDPTQGWYQGIPFTGLFDGRGHTILRLNIQAGSFLGVFGQLESAAEVKNLGAIDVNVIGSGDYVAGLAALNNGAVSGCYCTGAVSGTRYVGGLLGYSRGAVTRCYSVGAVSGNGYVGGLAGSNAGAVVFDTPPATHNIPGGAISACFSTATVAASGDYVGGLVGDNELGNVADCFSTGSVTGGQKHVGGLVGRNGWWLSRGPVLPIVADGSVVNCYSIGAVSATGGVGGLVGYDPSSMYAGIVISSFWDVNTSGRVYSARGIDKTTAEMQTAKTFLDAGWDFVGETGNGTDDVWWIFDGKDYPHLSWERVLGDDFEDGKAEPLWFAYEPEPERVRLREVNGRLEVEAIAQEEDVDSIYAANGWRLDVAKPFALRVDFHFSKSGVGDGRVTLGVVPSLDPSGMRWAELEAGCFDTDPFYLYEVRDKGWVQERVKDRSSNDGTLYMSYDPETDELYFSYSGYGKANAWQTIPGLLKGRWASEAVYVILSGGSQGMALEPGDAWLDDLIINSGTLLPPDPTGDSDPGD